MVSGLSVFEGFLIYCMRIVGTLIYVGRTFGFRELTAVGALPGTVDESVAALKQTMYYRRMKLTICCNFLPSKSSLPFQSFKQNIILKARDPGGFRVNISIKILNSEDEPGSYFFRPRISPVVVQLVPRFKVPHGFQTSIARDILPLSAFPLPHKMICAFEASANQFKKMVVIAHQPGNPMHPPIL